MGKVVIKSHIPNNSFNIIPESPSPSSDINIGFKNCQ